MLKKNIHHGKFTVGELRDLIKDLPEDATVLTEGCDCTGDSCGLEYDAKTRQLTVLRFHWYEWPHPDDE